MVKIGPKSVPTRFRAGERGVFPCAHQRGQRREHITLVNMGNGKVALGRESDQMDLNINAVEEIRKRHGLRLFELKDILSDAIDPGLKKFFEEAVWFFARVKTEDLLENFLTIVYKPMTYNGFNSLSDIDQIPENNSPIDFSDLDLKPKQ